MIYFDNAATTPTTPSVRETVLHMLSAGWANASSVHRMGFAVAKRLEEARHFFAKQLQANEKQVLFTGCATESNNIAIHSACQEAGIGDNVLLSSVEHSSVAHCATYLERKGIEVRYIPVDAHGRCTPEDVEALGDEKTKLVAVMAVNNELGTIQPIEEIGRRIKAKNANALFLVDGVQAFSKMDVSVGSLPIDFFSASGHKFYAPKGVGLLYVKEPTKLHPLCWGGGQEHGLRPGTENVAFIWGMQRAYEQMLRERDGVKALYDRAVEHIVEMEDVHWNSPREKSSPYIINIGFSGVKSEVLMRFMEQKEMYLSAGSACHGAKASSVLRAIKVPADYIEGSVRISFQTYNTLDEVDRFFEQLKKSVTDIRGVTRSIRR